ncbi:hypothetical protein VW098_12230 [Phaeobacter sp. JH57H2]|uniref:hypothetical protein n=1 Tax=unclassified Phaeobacter TaxID=2621772 RepID=UPI003A85A485
MKKIPFLPLRERCLELISSVAVNEPRNSGTLLYGSFVSIGEGRLGNLPKILTGFRAKQMRVLQHVSRQ